jgi:DivIVA domain-containing protein
MEQDYIDRIRRASFTLTRRGYDRREVDEFLQKMADWLEAGGDDETQSEALQAELARIGEQTAQVLRAAGEAAAAIKADAVEEARELIDDARIRANAARIEADRHLENSGRELEDYEQRTRGQADAYAGERRAEADAEAEEVLKRAKAEADKLAGEGRKRREDLEAVISDLSARRDALLDELEKLAGSLAGTMSAHRRAEASAEGNGAEEPAERPKAKPTERPARAKSN